MPPILDLAAQVAVVGYAVEIFKDVFQRAPTNVVRAFMYGASFVLVGLATWTPGLALNEYLLTVLMQGGAVATAAWAAHAGVKAVVPTLPTVAAAEAKAKGETPVRSRAELEAEGRAKEEAALLDAEATRITAIVRRELAASKGVTPQRVEVPPAPVVSAPAAEQKAVPKDSS